MDRKKFIPIIVVAALAVMAFAGVTVYRNVYAAAPIATINTAITGSFNGPNMGHGIPGGTSDTELATALGIDVTKLQAAYTTATNDALAQAVTSGQITQSQADQLKANGGRFDDRFGPFQITGIDYNALLAKALGITTDQLTAGYVKAYNTNIDAQVTSGNLTQTQADLMKGEYALSNNAKYQSAMKTAFTSAVGQAVTDGVITQAQADQILANSANTNFGMMGGGHSGPGFGGRGGPGGEHGGFGGRGQGGNNNPNNTTPVSPTVTPSGL